MPTAFGAPQGLDRAESAQTLAKSPRSSVGICPVNVSLCHRRSLPLPADTAGIALWRRTDLFMAPWRRVELELRQPAPRTRPGPGGWVLGGFGLFGKRVPFRGGLWKAYGLDGARACVRLSSASVSATRERMS
jgi:hypothetical protein